MTPIVMPIWWPFVSFVAYFLFCSPIHSYLLLAFHLFLTFSCLFTCLFVGLQENSYYIKPKVNVPKFGVRHYAGEVMYEVDGLLEKNRDNFRDDVLQILKDSRFEENMYLQYQYNCINVGMSICYMYLQYQYNCINVGMSICYMYLQYQYNCINVGMSICYMYLQYQYNCINVGMSICYRSDYVYDLFDHMQLKEQSGVGGAGGLGRRMSMKKKAGAKKKATVSSQFKDSLHALMTTLGHANPYFVRCIKPNMEKVRVH